MPELNEFDKNLAKAIHESKGMAGEPGTTVDGMLRDLDLEETDQNMQKLSDSLKKLISMQYIQKIDFGIPTMAAQYISTERYWRERETWWQGPKWGKKRARV